MYCWHMLVQYTATSKPVNIPYNKMYIEGSKVWDQFPGMQAYLILNVTQNEIHLWFVNSWRCLLGLDVRNSFGCSTFHSPIPQKFTWVKPRIKNWFHFPAFANLPKTCPSSSSLFFSHKGNSIWESAHLFVLLIPPFSFSLPFSLAGKSISSTPSSIDSLAYLFTLSLHTLWLCQREKHWFILFMHLLQHPLSPQSSHHFSASFSFPPLLSKVSLVILSFHCWGGSVGFC